MNQTADKIVFIKRSFAIDDRFSAAFNLSPSEKLQLIEDLWDDIAQHPENVPVHEWQKGEILRRAANLKSNPASALTWEQVKKRVRDRYKTVTHKREDKSGAQ